MEMYLYMGLISTKEPGRNAMIPLTVTLKPPLTRVLTKPFTIVPSFHCFF